jgi:Tol biopolymer transport system component
MVGVSGFVWRRGWLVVLAVSAVMGLGTAAVGAPTSRSSLGVPGSIVRVSVGTTGAQAKGDSVGSAVSADGRYVVFVSDAPNLVHVTPPHLYEVFVRDRVAHTTRLISVSTSGVEGNEDSSDPSISADGRYVAFDSYASNLVPGDTGQQDVFVRDRVAHTTRLISVSLRGRPANGDSLEPSISAHGRFVAFTSSASNLAPGLTFNRDRVFVRDRVSHTTRRVSVPDGGGPINDDSSEASISADGRFVAFSSAASNLVAGAKRGGIFIRDRARHTTHLISVGLRGKPPNNASFEPSISADGRYVAFVSNGSNLVRGDTNGVSDVFVRDRVGHTTRRVSVSTTGHQTRQTRFDSAMTPSISAHGRFVAFNSTASNLAAGDTNRSNDVFVRDTVNHTTQLVSVNLRGRSGNADSRLPAISADGRSVVFVSIASDLVRHDTNNDRDVFVRDRPKP